MSAKLPVGVQDMGVPFDVFIQALTLQLDKAQASMAIKARVGRLPLTFAVKDVTLDLRAFVRVVNDDIWVRPAGPGDEHASSIKLSLTTVTKPMIDENAVNFETQAPQFTHKEGLTEHFSESDQRALELIGVHNIEQLQDLRKAAGADVVARLARMPVNRLQQAMLSASAPRVTSVKHLPTQGDAPPLARVGLRVAGLRPGLGGKLPIARVQGQALEVQEQEDDQWVLHPLVSQLGQEAELEFEDGQRATVLLNDGSLGQWQQDSTPTQNGRPT